MKKNPLQVTLIVTQLTLVFIAGCATQPATFKVEKMTDFPAYNTEETQDQIDLNVLFLLDENGQVKDLRLLNSSGNMEWDREALDSLRTWSFQVPPDAEESEFLIRRKIAVKKRTDYSTVQMESTLHLGILTTDSESLASSLFDRLQSGESFEDMVQHAREYESNAVTTEIRKDVKLSEFPRHVAAMIRNLQPGEVSRPVPANNGYLIVKRY